jgi:hypothetical protein
MSPVTRLAALLLCLGLLLPAGPARAVDEIQVYTNDIAAPREWSLLQHLNYPLRGRSGVPFPGGIPYRGTLYGTPELAYGVTDFYEVGLYLPFAAREDRFYPGGAKFRNLFVTPNVRPGQVYFGLNTEISWQPLRFTNSFWNLEFRPIMGIKLGRWELTTNPIVGVGIGGKAGNAFEPANRVIYEVREDLAFGLESYSDFGPFGDFHSPKNQSHQLFAVTEFNIGPVGVNFGIGRGLTASSDRWAVKTIVGFSF